MKPIFCQIAYFIIHRPFMWKFLDQIFEILSDGINATQRLFYWTWQCFFRYEQPWCIFSAMILVLDKYEVFRSIYSEKSILNSFHLKKDLRIEKVNFQKSFDHLSCCWLNVVPVQTDSHMVKRVWYNMKIHPFSGNLFFRNLSKIFIVYFS